MTTTLFSKAFVALNDIDFVVLPFIYIILFGCMSGFRDTYSVVCGPAATWVILIHDMGSVKGREETDKQD